MTETLDEADSPLTSLSDFCAPMLDVLPRAQQRRWAHVYLRGLVELPGRKSIRRIAEHVLGASAGRSQPSFQQSLQQFLNQSPWEWEPVRQRLARVWQQADPPRAWVIDELALPKHGPSSVGVATQFVPSLKRTVRCQLALAVFALGATGAGPIGWQLMLPPRWAQDSQARVRCGVPDRIGSLTRGEYVFQLLDELLLDPQLPRCPVVLDATACPDVGELVVGLERRGLEYQIRVPASTSLNRLPPGSPVPARQRRLASVGRTVGSSGGPGHRRLIPQPGTGTDSAATSWLTNRTGPAGRSSWPADGAAPARSIWLARQAGAALIGQHGLHDFEGRSFRGWHHHVTLVSVAHAARVLAGRPGAPRSTGR